MIPGNYTGFLQVLNKFNLKPARPIDTFIDFNENSFSVPDELKDRKTTEVKINGCDPLKLYEGVPKISSF